MPEAFDRCVRGGGRVRTIKGPNKRAGLKAGQYRHICFPKDGGHPVLGEIKENSLEKALRKGGKARG